MDFNGFKQTLHDKFPPSSASIYLKALWYDAAGNWEHAHDLVDGIHDETASHIHAYLHRKEGDKGNAAYWYRRAGIKSTDIPFEKEWEEIVIGLL